MSNEVQKEDNEIQEVKSRPELGKIKLLHQAEEEGGACIYCGELMSEWVVNGECPARQ